MADMTVLDYAMMVEDSHVETKVIEYRRSANTGGSTGELLAVGDPVFPPAKVAPQTIALPPGGLLIMQVLPDGNAAKGSKKVTYTPNLPSGGPYTVFIRYTQGTNRATNVPVTSTGTPDAVSRKMAATVSPATSGTVRAPRAARLHR
jgi:hypothetical protein